MKTLIKSGALPHALLASVANVPAAVLGPVMADGGNSTEQLMAKLSAKVDTMSTEIKATAEDALKQVKNLGTVNAETKAASDKAISELTATAKAVEDLKAMIEGIEGKVLDVSQQVAAGGPGDDRRPMSLGQAFIAEEDKIAAFNAAGCSGTLSVTVENAITTAAGSAGGLISHPEETTPVQMARRRFRIWQMLTQSRTASDLVTYRQQVMRINAAAMVAEGGTIPESAYGWDKATAAVKKIAHVTNITEEAMADSDQLQSEIDSELRYGLDLEREGQVLLGDGVGENLDGLIPNATAFVAAAGLPDATPIDRLRLAILQITLQDYVATSITLNPTNWAAIDLLKDSQARYIFGNPEAQTTPRLWGLDVVESNSMSVGEWLVGDIAMAATLYRRKDVDVLISSEHGTNFVEDMLTMKATERLAQAIKRSLAMITGNFTFA